MSAKVAGNGVDVNDAGDRLRTEKNDSIQIGGDAL